MITEVEFTNLITNQLAWEAKVDAVEDAMGCCLYDSDWVSHASRLFETTLGFLFVEDAVDTILWWMYEHTDKEQAAMWDKDGKVIPMVTLHDLWEFIKDSQK